MILNDNLISRAFILEQIQKAIDETTDRNEINQFEHFRDFIRVCPNVVNITYNECDQNKKYSYKNKKIYVVGNKEQYKEILGIEYGDDKTFKPTVILSGVTSYDSKSNVTNLGRFVFPIDYTPFSIDYEKFASTLEFSNVGTWNLILHDAKQSLEEI